MTTLPESTDSPPRDATFPILRWQCPRGHFVAEEDTCSWDVIDPGEYYGVRAVFEYTCRGCTRDSDPYMYYGAPRLVEVGRSR